MDVGFPTNRTRNSKRFPGMRLSQKGRSSMKFFATGQQRSSRCWDRRWEDTEGLHSKGYSMALAALV